MGGYYIQPTRGKIQNRDRARQINDFSGLRFGNITPTDIDGLIEYKNKAYIIIELKYLTTKLPRGQELALERLTDDLTKSGKPTICIVASHEQNDPKEDIKVSDTIVIKYRRNRKWTKTEKTTTLQIIERFLEKIDPLYRSSDDKFELAKYVR